MNQRAGQTAVLLVLGVALAGCQDDLTTYEDCILEHLEGKTRSDAEVALLMEVCASRFPHSRGVELPAEELASLEVSVDRVSGRTLGVWVYNPTDWTISELRFVVHPVGSNSGERTYRERLQVPPESSSYVTIETAPDPLDFFGAPEDRFSEVTLASAAGWRE